MSVVKKINNYEYAPGISAYGVNGKDGLSGLSGSSIFISVYDITDDTGEGSKKFAEAVRYSYDMSSNERIKLNRPYNNEDCFVIQSTADIYKIKDVDKIRELYVQGQTDKDDILACLKFVGTIKSTSQNSGFESADGKLVLDTEQFKGFIINTSNSDVKDVYAPMTVVSTTSDNNNNIYFLSLHGVNQQFNTMLNIYYDTDNNCYHIQSDKPVMIDADLKVKYNQTEDYDGYSRVMTATNTNNVSLSSFYSFCMNTYNTVLYDNYSSEKVKITITFNTEKYNTSAILENQMVHVFLYKFKYDKNLNVDASTVETLREFYRFPITISNGSKIIYNITENDEDLTEANRNGYRFGANVIIEGATTGIIKTETR